MKTIISTAILMITMAISVSASAEMLRCESENVKISGHIQTRYLTMGHSVFSGNLNVLIYDHRKIVSASTVTIFSGDIQDESSINSSIAKDQAGQPARISIVQDGSSLLQIGSSSLQFAPHCQILANTTSPVTCSSNISLGLSCQTIQGKCICHQHNGH